MDREGRPRFYDLMFRGGEPRYAVFDILYKDGKDLRSLPLRKRKQILRRLIPEKHTHLLYVDRILDNGNGLFQKICDIDLEGIVAKPLTSLERSRPLAEDQEPELLPDARPSRTVPEEGLVHSFQSILKILISSHAV